MTTRAGKTSAANKSTSADRETALHGEMVLQHDNGFNLEDLRKSSLRRCPTLCA